MGLFRWTSEGMGPLIDDCGTFYCLGAISRISMRVPTRRAGLVVEGWHGMDYR